MLRGTALSAASLVLLILLALLYGYIRPEQEAGYFSTALKNTREDVAVTWHAHSYTVQGGVVYDGPNTISGINGLSVLKLAYRKVLAERNPLLDIAGSDPQEYLTALSHLESTKHMLADIQSDPQARSRVQNALYPITFLRELGLLEQTRLTLLRDGSDTAADAYDTQLQKTISAYQGNLVQFKDAFEVAVPENIKRYATAGTIVSYSSITHALDIFAHSMRVTHMRLYQRIFCAQGHISFCSPSDLLLPTIAIPVQNSLSLETTSLADRVRSIYSDAMNNPALKDQPVIELASTACSKGAGAPLFVVSGKRRITERFDSYPYPIPIGDIRLIDSSQTSSVPFITYFKNANIRYVLVSPLNYYECLDIAHDLGRIWYVQSIIDFSKSTPLSTYATVGDAGALTGMEKKFMSANTPVLESDALLYLQYARAMTQDGLLPTSVSSNVTSLLLQVRDKSARFDTVFENISRIEEANIGLEKEGVPLELDNTYLFYLRSAFAALFMDQNPSIVGDQTPLFAPNTISASLQPYSYYSSLSASARVDAEITRDMRFFVTMHIFPDTTSHALP